LKPLVSVVTPVLNAADTLELTLLSVSAQTYPNVEHIVIDGGSTDGSTDILDSFRSSAQLRWKSEPDSGMYSAINKGIELARGDYISYLNGDDLYFPWTIERAISGITAGRADLIFGDVLIISKRGGRAVNVWMQFYPRFDPAIFAYEVVMAQATVFWRSRVSDSLGGFDEAMQYSGDFEYWLRAAKAGFRFTNVREALAMVVQHERALSTVHADDVQREIDLVRVQYGDSIKPKRFRSARRLAHLLHWRRSQLLLRLNYARSNPSDWREIIPILKRAGVEMGSGTLALLLPKSLPVSWSFWNAEPPKVEREVVDELRRRS
jgi:glycosyltransferase involved in cell wall biosynthesis